MRTRSQASRRPESRGRAERVAALAGLCGIVLLVHLDLLLAPEARVPLDPARVLENEAPTPVTTATLVPLGRGGALGLHLSAALAIAAWLVSAGAGFVGGAVGAACYALHPLHAQAIGPDVHAAFALGHAALAGGLALAHTRGRWVGALLVAAGVALEPRGVGAVGVAWLLGAAAGAPSVARAARGPVLAGAALGLAVAAILPLAPGWGPPPPIAARTFAGLARATGWWPTVADDGPDVVASTAALAVMPAIGLVGALAALSGRDTLGLAGRLVVVWVAWAFAIVVGESIRGVAFAPLSLAATAVGPAALLAVVIRRVVAERRWKTAIAIVACALAPLIGRTARDASASASERSWIAAAARHTPGSRAVERRRMARAFHHFENRYALLGDYLDYVARHPRDARAWADRGRFLWSLRRVTDAAASFERAWAIVPHRLDVRYWLAATRLIARLPDAGESLEGVERTPEVRALAIRIAARAGEAPPSGRDADPPIVWRAIGIAHTEAGRWTDGLAALDRAAAGRPRDALLAAYRGWCLLELGRVEEGIDVLALDALRDESGFLAHKVLGELRVAPGPHHDRREALDHLRYFLRHEPTHPDADRLRGIVDAILAGDR